MFHDIKVRLAILVFVLVPVIGFAQGTNQPTYGIDFSPYLNGQDPNHGSQISPEQISSRLQIIAPYTSWVRSFGSTNGLENIPSIAHQMGLKVAANAWISDDTAQNTVEINNLIAAANAGLVDIAIVGSEAILRNNVTVNQMIAYMNQVRQAIPQNIPVTTADIWGIFIDNPSLIAASDVVFANFYPYWEGTPINNALCSLESAYQKLKNAAGSKQVYVSETGWPSAGNAVGAGVPSVANANLFALQFLSWANANGIKSFFFEAFDEAWKANYNEGPQGAHWGIWDVNAAVKPGMDAFFNSQTVAVDCNGFIPGPTGITFTYIPPYGSSDSLEAKVTGVHPTDYVLAAYIKVFGGWWTKPTFAQPTVAINPDGTAQIAIKTGGSDQLATDIAVFLIPASCTPPQVGGGALPSVDCAVTSLQAHRTPSSISGTITDNQNLPVTGAVISDPVLGTTTSAPDGKYSFYEITTSGTATLTVTAPSCTFSTSPHMVNISSSNQIVNFVCIRTLTVTPASLPAGYTGAPYAATLAAEGGMKPYSNWTISSGSLPPGLVLADGIGVINGMPTTTTGSPFLFSVTVKDQQGTTSAPQSLSITVVPGTTTSIVLASSANPSNQGQALTLTATLTPIPASGKITFFDGTTMMGIRGLSGATATLNTTMLPSGTRPLTAYYSGNAPFSANTSAKLGQVVRALPTSGFHTPPNFGASSFSSWIVLADFNGDGKSDLATSNSNFYTFSVYLGNDNGTFQSPINTSLPDYPDSIALGDFNGDGKADLVVVHSNRKLLRFFLGKGDGTFQNPISLSTLVGSMVAVADFNSDGKTDLAIYNVAGLTVLLGNGDGTFQVSPSFSAVSNPSSIAIGDFNGDGKADVAIGSANSSNNVSVLLGNGDGTFQTAVNLTAGSYARSIAVGDFNGDGSADLAVANFQSNNMSVLLGNGDGTFQSAVNFPTGASPMYVAVGDL